MATLTAQVELECLGDAYPAGSIGAPKYVRLEMNTLGYGMEAGLVYYSAGVAGVRAIRIGQLNNPPLYVDIGPYSLGVAYTFGIKHIVTATTIRGEWYVDGVLRAYVLLADANPFWTYAFYDGNDVLVASGNTGVNYVDSAFDFYNDLEDCYVEIGTNDFVYGGAADNYVLTGSDGSDWTDAFDTIDTWYWNNNSTAGLSIVSGRLQMIRVLPESEALVMHEPVHLPVVAPNISIAAGNDMGNDMGNPYRQLFGCYVNAANDVYLFRRNIAGEAFDETDTGINADEASIERKADGALILSTVASNVITNYQSQNQGATWVAV